MLPRFTYYLKVNTEPGFYKLVGSFETLSDARTQASFYPGCTAIVRVSYHNYRTIYTL